MATHTTTSTHTPRRALVTGASAGIGEAFARALAARGDDLVLVARSKPRLDDLAAELHEAHGVDVETLSADLTDPAQLATVEARVTDAAKIVGVLVNNAGIGTVGRFAELEIDGEEREIRLNVLAPMRLTHAALGAMAVRGAGAIVNVSSIAAYQPNPGMATYGATKAFVSSFTRAIQEEAKARGVQVMLLEPGFTRTEFQARAGVEQSDVPSFLWMSPAQVVDAAMRTLDRGGHFCVPGTMYRAAATFSDVAPSGLSRRVAGLLLRRGTSR
jgi:short-subunit dehydrogenase